MKKIALLISIVSLLTLAACGSTPSEDANISTEVEVTNTTPENDTTTETNELSEEEVNALFEEMMNQAEMEAQAEAEMEAEVESMPYVEANGELNPGMTE